MPQSYVQYLGDGRTTLFTIPFDFLSRSHVTATVAGTPVALMWEGEHAVRVPSAPPAETIIQLTRSTPKEAPIVNFVDGSVLTEHDLDLAALQLLFAAQEASDRAERALGTGPDGAFTARGLEVRNLAPPMSPGSATSRQWVEDTLRTALQGAAAEVGAVPIGRVGNELVAPNIYNPRMRKLSEMFRDRLSILDIQGVQVDGVSSSNDAFASACAEINSAGAVIALPPLAFSVDCDVIRIGTGSATRGSLLHGGGMVGVAAPLNAPGQGTTIRARDPGQALATISGITSGVTWKGILLDCDSKANIALDTYSVCGSEIEVIARQFLYYGLAMRCRAPAGSAGWSSSNTIRPTSIVSSVVMPYGAGILLEGEHGVEQKNYDPHNNTFLCGTIQIKNRADGPVYGLYSGMNDSNTFIEVDFSVYGPGHPASCEHFMDASTREYYPQNNFFYGCSIKRHRSRGLTGTSVALFHPTKDGEEIPTDPYIRGITDDGKFFGSWELPPSQTDFLIQKDTPALNLFTPEGARGARIYKNAGGDVDFGLSFDQFRSGNWRTDLVIRANDGCVLLRPPSYTDNASAKAGGLSEGMLYWNGTGMVPVHP